MSFGEWLLSTLEDKGWPQAELARRSHITGTQISRIISGQRHPGIDAITGIAQALEMPVDEVIRRVGGLPQRTKLRDGRRIVYELNADEALLARYHALKLEDQELVRDLIERLGQVEPRIIGERPEE